MDTVSDKTKNQRFSANHRKHLQHYQGSSYWAYLEAAEHCGEGTISFGSSQLYLELPPSLSTPGDPDPGTRPSGVETSMQCCIPMGYLSCNPT